jgi:hypothetical protein
MVILRSTTLVEKCVDEVLESFLEILFVGFVAGAFDVTFQAVQVVPCVEIVDPPLILLLSVKPRPIGQLPGAAVVYCLSGQLPIIIVPVEFRGPCQHRGAEQV